MTVAQTILSQLGGNRLVAMTGAKNFVDTGRGLAFTLPARLARDGINTIKVELQFDDLYCVTFARRRGVDYAVRKAVGGVYADQLRATIESATGLALSL